MENLRNRLDVRLFSIKNFYLKLTSKTTYISEKVFDNDLVAIRKSKVTLKLNKASYARICILDLKKVLMNKFHWNYIESEYGQRKWQHSRLLLLIMVV